jgi:hypothetical protein
MLSGGEPDTAAEGTLAPAAEPNASGDLRTTTFTGGLWPLRLMAHSKYQSISSR